MLFRFDNRSGFYRCFRLRLLFNSLLLFGFLFCFLLFFTEAQPGKEATFFVLPSATTLLAALYTWKLKK
jgi:hypothetical protein